MKKIRTLSAALFASLLALTPAAADIYNWSQTGSSNTNSDLADDVNWAEGMAPSEVNDSARAMMAEIAKWRDDLGAVRTASALMTTGGTANAQTLTTNGTASALTHGWTVCFIVGSGLTPTSTFTLNVDSLGAKTVQGVDGTAAPAGSMAAGTLQCATYQSSDEVWLLHQYKPIDATSITYTSAGVIQRAALTGDVAASAGSNTTTIQAGAVEASMLASDVYTKAIGEVFYFAGGTCPAKSVAAYGQELDDTTYSALLAVIGTTFGGGGASTFNAPDLRDRMVIGDADMGGVDAAVISSYATTTLGGTGGEDEHTPTTAETAAHTHTADGTLAVAAHTHTWSDTSGSNSASHTHDVSGNTGSNNVSHNHSYTDRGDNSSSHSRGSGSQVTSNSGSGGYTTGSQNQNHTHSWSDTSSSQSANHTHDVSGTTSGPDTSDVTGSTSSTGSGTAFNVINPFIVMNVCIFTGV